MRVLKANGFSEFVLVPSNFTVQVGLETQERLVEKASDLRAATVELEKIASAKVAHLDELRQSLLQHAFAGELT